MSRPGISGRSVPGTVRQTSRARFPTGTTASIVRSCVSISNARMTASGRRCLTQPHRNILAA